MSMTFKTLAFAAAAATALSVGALVATTAPASARVVCDWDGDHCWNTHSRYEDEDEDGWRRDWYERRRWEERRERDAYRRWYWSREPYYPDYRYPAYNGGSIWFSF